MSFICKTDINLYNNYINTGDVVHHLLLVIFIYIYIYYIHIYNSGQLSSIDCVFFGTRDGKMRIGTFF